jgi:hypothetical protein
MRQPLSRPWDDMQHDAQELLRVAMVALRRVRSLEEKNVPKYAQQIVKEALRDIEPHWRS